jgi:transcriptional regulator with XRE-family HTH domain
MNASGISQRELSKRMGMPSSYVNKLVRGHRLVELTELVDLADALGTPAQELISFCLIEQP